MVYCWIFAKWKNLMGHSKPCSAIPNKTNRSKLFFPHRRTKGALFGPLLGKITLSARPGWMNEREI